MASERRSPALRMIGAVRDGGLVQPGARPVARARRPRGQTSLLEKKLTQRVGQAVAEHQLIADGDRIMVCVSGGKDSYALLDVLQLMQRRAPVKFELVAVNVDQGWPGYQTSVIRDHLISRGVEHRMVESHEIAGIVERVLRPSETGATPCSLCSRLRRGVLYGLATELGATKIALGHHVDDAAETLLLNLFFAGQLRGMPARYSADDARHTVIRPLIYVEEADLIAYAAERAYPTVRCSCPTCGLPEQQRQVMKRMLTGLDAEHPGLKARMLAAMKNVRPGTLLDADLAALVATHATPNHLANDAAEPV
ncbi:MAG: tRNA 2-thiocytidine(32) synthetase TtcA [Polyangia bacterium]